MASYAPILKELINFQQHYVKNSVPNPTKIVLYNKGGEVWIEIYAPNSSMALTVTMVMEFIIT